MDTQDFLSRLQNELQHLPGEEAHMEMIPFRTLSSEALKTAIEYKTSAVIAIMFPSPEGIQLVLTERQDYGGKHSGQIAFPGGKEEPEDRSIVDTALRETKEEIGIDPNQIQILGQLTDVYIPVSGYLVHPFVGYMDQAPEYILEEREVKSAFSFPVMELLNEEIKSLAKIQNHKGLWMKDIPCFQIQKKTVWGATALMLNEIRFILRRF